ncbi:choloylglycine hydrolase family protein [Weissella muntiaci]|uniref:Choloylglycine hydrolase family protein n=1 Tax=Weissella muntiaci TaxID=2508881 RepID=A0A6C2CA49_9LACO|nr:choloylglycine hydrolase family protein [Weissella muntiaci]TYC50273.1 choloylglycine hydrolase family protein [Weissella muntiaci]
MCTSIKMHALDNNILFARTMDWHTFPATPLVLPRDYEWLTAYDQRVVNNKYAILGVGHSIANLHVDLSDGINEYGLAGQKLTFSNKSGYNNVPQSDKLPLAPLEFILWLLGNFKSVDDVVEHIHEVQLMTAEHAAFDYGRNDLHFALTDPTGAMISIEPIDGELIVINNPIGVVTNAPNFQREIAKLDDYMDFSTTSTLLNGISSGNFSGKPAFPGGFTPTARFIRATILKDYAVTPIDEANNVIETWHILNSVTVPKSTSRSDTYTIYRSAYSIDKKQLYYQGYNDLAIQTFTFPIA